MPLPGSLTLDCKTQRGGGICPINTKLCRLTFAGAGDTMRQFSQNRTSRMQPWRPREPCAPSVAEQQHRFLSGWLYRFRPRLRYCYNLFPVCVNQSLADLQYKQRCFLCISALTFLNLFCIGPNIWSEHYGGIDNNRMHYPTGPPD